MGEQGRPSSTVPVSRVVTVVLPGAIVVGAGPSGLAVAASLRRMAVPCVVVERSDGIAELWRRRTYDRLSLHLPKRFCELPHLPFPRDFPTYPSRRHFLSYLIRYSRAFAIEPLLRCTVVSATFDPAARLWRVVALHRSPPSELAEVADVGGPVAVEYMARWLVVATGENAEPVVPKLKGVAGFRGRLLHSSEYKSGVVFEGQRVLVIGCGNSGMEVCLDLHEHGAWPSMAVRSGVHVLPRKMLGTSTFGLAMKLLKWLPVRLVDRFLLAMARLVLGNTEVYGLRRPEVGPLELKASTGKTPVLDVGALRLIKNGSIKVVPEVESLTGTGAKFVDGKEMAFDSVIFATGYRSNDCDLFSEDGKPRVPFPEGWKGKKGLYFVGFTGRGLLGAGADAVNVARDIAREWNKLSDCKNLYARQAP
ncbi:hypothetical protein Taro_012529 [Colocasia esculenta]|uniref:Flavin-containing monooxygenase n=1 Tax=Colocasia esculenta TaxID=4460 RepID=A0A843U983_COLES|nr:hypothetical protein [Colocasia esculenta]